jgi:hypothetical protein
VIGSDHPAANGFGTYLSASFWQNTGFRIQVPGFRWQVTGEILQNADCRYLGIFAPLRYRLCVSRLHTDSQILYLASMRYGCFLICIALLMGCGGRSISHKTAKNLIVDLPREVLEKEDVEVIKMTHVGSTEAIAETQLKAAFRFEKVNDEWIIREVRIGHGQWAKIDNLTRALETVRIEETRNMLGQIAEAVLKYHSANESMPVFDDYISLSDLLSPRYLTPLIRLDAWRNPLGAERPDGNTVVVWSAGPDGQHGTADDIRRAISP